MNVEASPQNRGRVPYLCQGIIAALTIGYTIFLAALFPALEHSCCLDYYQKHDPSIIGPGGVVPPELCQVDPVQHRLAWTNGSLECMRYIVELLVASPLGERAEKYGRRPILLLKIGGQLTSLTMIFIICYFRTFPTWFVLATPFLPPVGGGFALAKALVFGTTAATTTNQSKRASLEFNLEGTLVLCQCLGPLIGFLLVRSSIFIPFVTGLSVMAVSLIPILLLPIARAPAPDAASVTEESPLLEPESQNRPPSPQADHPSASSGDHANDIDPETVPISDDDTTSDSGGELDARAQDPEKQRMISVSAYISFFVSAVGTQTLSIMPQYVWARFNFPLTMTGVLFAIKAFPGAILLYTVAWSYATGGDVLERGFRTAKKTIVALAVGYWIMGFATNIWIFIPGLLIYAFGLGFSTTVRTIINNFTPRDSITRAYTRLSKGETLGLLIGSLVMTATLDVGISIGGWGVGLPYFVAGGALGITSILLLIVFNKVKEEPIVSQ